MKADQEHKPQVLALSGFLSVAFDTMKSTIEQVEAAGLREGLRSSSVAARWTTPSASTPAPTPTAMMPWRPSPLPKRPGEWRKATGAY